MAVLKLRIEQVRAGNEELRTRLREKQLEIERLARLATLLRATAPVVVR